MNIHPLAGKPAPAELLIDTSKLEHDYYALKPDPANPNQLVSFGTSGHRGSPFNGTFTESHVLAITQAICDYRRSQQISGPLFLGKDTHGVSGLAERTALEVLAANNVNTFFQGRQAGSHGFTPTPAISLAILACNQGAHRPTADGIVITPSHNPPADGGIKYNARNGGPAETETTNWIQQRANELLRNNNVDVKRLTWEAALRQPCVQPHDFLSPYLDGLSSVINLKSLSSSHIRIGIDPLGGAALDYWEQLAQRFGLNITLVNRKFDPAFGFMTLDYDGKIRMDCSSPYAMASLAQLKDRFDIAFGNDPDADRHGIVTPTAGLMDPNHYLAVAISYLLTTRRRWPVTAAVGKTVVTSGMLDKVVKDLNRTLCEVPVGFKYFANPLWDGACCFGGEESAGASFLRQDGTVWTTDKDGLILGLLAAEITARTGKDPGVHYKEITARFGPSYYKRIDAPATPAQKAAFKNLTPQSVTATTLGGEPILQKLTRAPGNGAPIGGLKVITQNGWFAARPSGTENLYKVYAESFTSPEHLAAIIEEAKQILTRSLPGAQPANPI